MTLPPAIFAFAHPDDETLAAGVAIAEHVNAGQDVRVLILTDGGASAVRNQLNGSGTGGWWGVTHDPAAEGYEPLDATAFGQARLDEAQVAVRCLSAGLTGTLSLHVGHLPDGGVTVSTAAAAIVELADLVAPGAPVRVKTHSPIVDDHPDHVAIGTAAVQLAADARFADLRHYILPSYWQDPRLSQVSEVWDNPGSTAIANRARNACRAYGAWHPPDSFAVGYHSVHAMFDQLLQQPRCMVHQ